MRLKDSTGVSLRVDGEMMKVCAQGRGRPVLFCGNVSMLCDASDVKAVM